MRPPSLQESESSLPTFPVLLHKRLTRSLPSNVVPTSDTQPPTFVPATDLYQFLFLFCVPNTQTYLFFSLPSLFDPNTSPLAPLYPNTTYAAAINAGIVHINSTIAASGDMDIPNGSQTLPDTQGIRIYAEDAGGHHLTWGVLGSALTGLNTWMGTLNKYGDATYQINDGANRVGQGYIGTVVGDACVLAAAAIERTPCVARDNGGDVYFGDQSG